MLTNIYQLGVKMCTNLLLLTFRNWTIKKLISLLKLLIRDSWSKPKIKHAAISQVNSLVGQYVPIRCYAGFVTLT